MQCPMVWFISKKTIVFQGSRGGPTFFLGGGGGGGGGGSNFFQTGSNCLFPKETHITCDFQGVGGGGHDHVPLLDPCITQENDYFNMEYTILIN